MRENALLQTNEEDRRELQTFGRMQRHQGQRIIAQLRIINIRYERNIRQEALQRCLLAVTRRFFRKILRYTQKFLQVFDTALILRTIAALQLCQIACFVQNILHELLHRRLSCLAHQVKKNLAQLIQLISKAAAESRNISRVRHHLEQALLAACRISLQLAQRRITDTTTRHVDNTQQRQAVVRIKNQTQISENILNLLALIEFQTADHAIGNTALNQGFLENTRLRIGAVKHSHIAQLGVFLLLQLLHTLNNKARLVMLVRRFISGNQ